MRPLVEIIESLKDGEKPTYDELYFSLLVVNNLSTMDITTIREIQANKNQLRFTMFPPYDECHNRWHRALNADPQVYLGPNNTPGNPEHDRFRRMAKNILKKVEDKMASEAANE